MSKTTATAVSNEMGAQLADLLVQWGQGKSSVKKMVGLTDEELYAIASQGYFLFLQGKSAPARVVFEGLIAIDPRNAYYHRALGAIYWRLKEPQRAIRQLTYAIRVSPRDITNYVNRAEIYVAQKQFKLARSDLQFAIATGLAHEQALIDKARALLHMIS